jgi:two-component system, OmpR family, osmolarity sensor histidine kinase EnvZ
MFFAWLKRYMPRGLYGRAALILLMPIITLQLVVSVVFIQRHFERVTVQMTNDIELELAALLSQVGAAGDIEAATIAARRYGEPLELNTRFRSTPEQTDNLYQWYDFSGRVVIGVLRARFPNLRQIDLASDERRVQLRFITRYGPFDVDFSRDRVSARNPHQFLVLLALTGVLMATISMIFLRNQLRPIRRLAHAAEDFGKGRSVTYKPLGATEVRAAGMAFLDMRARIERQIEQRTMMLSGVSHDLRTPLTRLKLHLSMMEDCEDTREMSRDIKDMERLLDEFLSFARGESLDNPLITDPASLARDLVSRLAMSGDVSLGTCSGEGTVSLRPPAVGRALENLIGNALRHGSCARLSYTMSDRALVFSVEDDGPGIPAEKREEALKPFARLDQARNQNNGGGVGLGLSIANDIARGHGGSIRLGTSESLGGLRVDLILAR